VKARLQHRYSLDVVDKQELREQIRAGGPVAENESRQVVEALFVWMSRRLPGTVSAFLAMSGEVDVSPLFTRLPGWRWVLPRVEPDKNLTFRDRDVPRERHRFGMDQPVDMGHVIAINQIDVLVTPGLAFDMTGGRLGNGGGFYDRILSAKRSDAVAVAATVKRRVVESVPMQDHDQRVDWIATEEGVIRCSSNS
jgi:5-formyltetrahydrofolate cyclo-ligase